MFQDKKQIIFFLIVIVGLTFAYLFRKGVIFELTYQWFNSPFNTLSIQKSSESISLPKTNCDQNIWKYVYEPDRLFIIQPCVTLSGVVERVDLESDGDNHIYFRLDNTNPKLVNIFNQIFAGSDIIAEMVCLNEKQIDDQKIGDVCSGYENKIPLPRPGMHIRMFGVLVLDKNVGWLEIHPVTQIE